TAVQLRVELNRRLQNKSTAPHTQLDRATSSAGDLHRGFLVPTATLVTRGRGRPATVPPR
ncbi:hypothetical protein HBB16_05385, partial [Pseudonocardia sp. MCCB 268]|nr:hypothetical protein [Pseudonocardia cytotoxica]